MEKISIIVPVFNSEKTIERCLTSLINQSYFDIEIIVVDDGSTDRTARLIEKIAEKTSLVKYFYQENSGVSAARNLGISKSNGEYIMFVDSDDCLEQNACELLISEYDVDIDFVICGLNIYIGDKLLRTPNIGQKDICLGKNIDDYWELRKINLGPCNKLYRSSLILKKFDESLSFGEDTKFVIDYMKNVKFIKVISNCLYNVYLDNENSLNRSSKSNKLIPLLSVREYEKQFLEQKYPKNKDCRIFQRFFLDLHVVVTSIIKENKRKLALQLLENNLNQYDYKKILGFTKFDNIYYKLFSIFSTYHYKYLLYILVWTRIKVGAL